MKINVIATGSSGNCYEILDNKGNSIIIDAGVPRSTYIKFRECEKPPEMCIVSHKHADHFKYFNEFSSVIPTFIFEPKLKSDNFQVVSFEVKHGDAKCNAFIIKLLQDNDFLFFGTDFEFDEYEELFNALKFLEVEKFIIECSYNDYLYHLADKIQREGLDRHLSDNDLIRFIKKTGAKNPKIITIHGSNRLSIDTYTRKYLKGKLLTATVAVATGAKNNTKNLFNI